MVVVTAILALLATLIVPNLVAIQRSRALRETRAAILRLAVDARNKARDLKTPLILQVQGDALVLEPDTEQATTPTINTNRLMTGANTNANTTPDASSFQQRVTLGNDIYVLSARQNGDTMDVGNWRWEVYPDGSATEGGLVFQLGEERKALYLPIEEQPRWVDGDLPDPTEERWQAGEVEQRVSS